MISGMGVLEDGVEGSSISPVLKWEDWLTMEQNESDYPPIVYVMMMI